ncbi:nuclear transport factor 2 family protein [Streptomyces sp. NPDC058734]|uniref:nuclear transport factor 2 family protein n=1 Tax=Streptomyces sp. NPDC058734 TaxID=3346615 RepID=UPI00368C6EF8
MTTSMTTTTAGRSAVSADLYLRIQHFYAHQMQHLDSGRFEEYAATFTEDGEFQHSPGVEPARTRPGIVRELVGFHERFDNDPVQRRHWFNHIALELQEDGTVSSTAYALVVNVRPGGKPEITRSCVVHDTVVDGPEGILLKSRRVTHDEG